MYETELYECLHGFILQEEHNKQNNKHRHTHIEIMERLREMERRTKEGPPNETRIAERRNAERKSVTKMEIRAMEEKLESGGRGKVSQNP